MITVLPTSVTFSFGMFKIDKVKLHLKGHFDYLVYSS